MPRMRGTRNEPLRLGFPPALLLAVCAGCSGRQSADPAYVQEIDQWHAQRVERLRSDSGWLTLVGLHELKEGLSTAGSDSTCDVVMCAQAPAKLGQFAVEDGEAMFAAAPGVQVRVGEGEGAEPISHAALATDANGPPTVLSCGSLLMHVIDRHGRLYLRVKDRQSPLLAEFQGIERYPVDEKWRVTARLEDGPPTVSIPDVLGQAADSPSPGTLVFTLQGKECKLTPTADGMDLFIVFADPTNGKGTYPGGRFLSAKMPGPGGTLTLDFNRAYNPPCVFTPYATCPLPPPQNRLPVAVAAGEKTWGQGH